MGLNGYDDERTRAMRYRKKQEVVDAFMLTDLNMVTPGCWPDWAFDSLAAAGLIIQLCEGSASPLTVSTLRSWKTGDPKRFRHGDWVVRDGAVAKFITEKEFRESYEEVPGCESEATRNARRRFEEAENRATDLTAKGAAG